MALVNHQPVHLPWESSVSFTPESPSGAFVWGIDAHQAGMLIDQLERGQDPHAAPPQAWAAVVRQPDGGVVAASSPAYQSGLVWSIEQGGDEGALLHVGPFLGGVVQARRQPTELSSEFAAAKLGRGSGVAAVTPFAQVHRAPGGTTLRWPSLADPPRISQWCGPDAWPEPSLSGERVVEEYRRTFDQAVDAVLPDGPLFATLSGGLDSSLVVASLMRHAREGRQVEAFVHSPHPDAQLGPQGNWDPDDFPIAESMRSLYPSGLNIHRVINEERRQPLDQAERSARRLWYPTPNTFNHVWLRLMDEQVGGMGGGQLFVGSSGNAAFSFDHPYAAGYHARRGEWADVAQISRPYSGQKLPGISVGPRHAARSTAASARGIWRARRHHPAHPWHAWVPAAKPLAWTSEGTARERFLRWLAATDHRGLTAAHAGWTAPHLDPFATQTMVELAAAIKPAAWARAGSPRGFARLVAEGRVPDDIRLRTRRGAQSWDGWYIVHDQRDRYTAEAELLAADPMLGPHVELGAVRATLDSWPWGQPRAPQPAGLLPLTDLLAFGVAWRTLGQMLASLSS